MLQTPLSSDVSLTEMTLGGVPVLEISVPGPLRTPHSCTSTAVSSRSGRLAQALASPAFSRGKLARECSRLTTDSPRSIHPRPPPTTRSAPTAACSKRASAPERIGLFGESAGGALALGVLVAGRDAGLAQPAAAVLYSPWVDLTLSGASMETKAAVDFVLARDRLQHNVSDYAGGADPAAAALSPLFADLRGIAPLLIQCGSNEVLLDDATRLAAAAATADVTVQLDVTPGAAHVFQASAPELDEANAALTRTGAFLQAHLQLAE